MSSIIMPDDGRQDRGIVPSILAIESGLNKILPTAGNGGLDQWVDGKIKTAIEVTQLFSQSTSRQSHEPFKKPILESKAIQDVGSVTDSKSYRNFNRKMRNAWNRRDRGRELLSNTWKNLRKQKSLSGVSRCQDPSTQTLSARCSKTAAYQTQALSTRSTRIP